MLDKTGNRSQDDRALLFEIEVQGYTNGLRLRKIYNMLYGYSRVELEKIVRKLGL